MSEQAEADGDSVLAWMLDVLGSPLLGYLLNCDSVNAQAILDERQALSDEQVRVMEALSARRAAALSEDLDESRVLR